MKLIRPDAMRQVGVALAMCTLALAVCCAIIASSDLGSGKTSLLQVIPYGLVVAPRRILYGLGSGEEQDAANQNEVAWGTFAGQDAYAEDLLGDEHYLVQFEDALHSDATEEAIEEASAAVGEGKNEHDLLAAFASGMDAPLE